MAKNIQKRLRHLRGVWERQAFRRSVTPSTYDRGFKAILLKVLGLAKDTLRMVRRKPAIKARKYRVPKYMRRREHSGTNG